jgi:hypothetical protein
VAGAVRTHMFIGHRSKWSGTITSVTSAIRRSHSRCGSGLGSGGIRGQTDVEKRQVVAELQ